MIGIKDLNRVADETITSHYSIPVKAEEEDKVIEVHE
jgi:hypothetical protein